MTTQLSELFGSSARTEVLETLFLQPHEIGLRQIVGIADLPVRSVQMALNSLTRDGLVRRRAAGPRVLFALNRTHPASGLLKDVFLIAETHRIQHQAERHRSAGRDVMQFMATAMNMMERARRSRRET